MQDTQACTSVIKSLSGAHSAEEREAFLKWRKESESNDEFYHKAKSIWDQPIKSTTFLGKFTSKKIKWFLVNQAIGNLIGFIIGLSVTHLFSHYVIEKRGVNNLFGLAGRKKIIVNDTPEWLRWALPVIIGFIALEFVNHFIETKQHQAIWQFLKSRMKTKQPN
ncbi:MAG: hypothetical protein H0W61_02495 [Bacteroidetes bacterium]|nr:hypothetical protein [Bacteroidota bacterium]